MKRLLYGIAGVLLTLNLPAANTAETGSKITEATVFMTGAELTHTATARLPKGESTLLIRGLCAEADAGSIRIRAGNGVLVSSFHFLTGKTEKQEEKPALKTAKAELEKLQEQQAELETRIRVNKELAEMLRKSIEKNTAGGESGIGLADLAKSLDYYKTRSTELETTLHADQKTQFGVAEKIREVQREIDRLNREESRQGTLRVNLLSRTEGDYNFTVSYHVGRAGWVPSHDIRVAGTDKPVAINSKAQVHQETGIDWNNIRINLSTTVPNNGKTAPLFRAWFLKPLLPVPLVSRSPQAMAQNSFRYAEAAGFTGAVTTETIAEEDMEMGQHITLTENQMNQTYHIDLPYSIPGNGESQYIELQSKEIPATFNYYCAPKLDPETWLLAEIANWETLNLLSGEAHITFEDTYIGTTYINAANTGSSLSLTLGRDKRVAVKREKMMDYSSSRTLGNDVKQEFMYQLTVRNNRNVPVNMVLKDQYPLSSGKEVTVELSKETATPSFNMEELGVVTWEFVLQAGETRTFRFGYSVKYPKSMSLNL
ncbi:MAG: mucoidy inhibitor MuiA family protein [Culturomica sp.]|jgi:uncharacterized protein (TIGR02231 family)|nr:mucoidy inhibitor MuiA family protein [Culturomica sp.]